MSVCRLTIALLYLWHWPIVAFAENYTGRPLNLGEAVILIAASIAIAAVS